MFSGVHCVSENEWFSGSADLESVPYVSTFIENGESVVEINVVSRSIISDNDFTTLKPSFYPGNILRECTYLENIHQFTVQGLGRPETTMSDILPPIYDPPDEKLFVRPELYESNLYDSDSGKLLDLSNCVNVVNNIVFNADGNDDDDAPMEWLSMLEDCELLSPNGEILSTDGELISLLCSGPVNNVKVSMCENSNTEDLETFSISDTSGVENLRFSEFTNMDSGEPVFEQESEPPPSEISNTNIGSEVLISDWSVFDLNPAVVSEFTGMDNGEPVPNRKNEGSEITSTNNGSVTVISDVSVSTSECENNFCKGENVNNNACVSQTLLQELTIKTEEWLAGNSKKVIQWACDYQDISMIEKSLVTAVVLADKYSKRASQS